MMERPSAVRRLIREGSWDKPTSGLCLGYLQANLAVLPRDLADEFQAVCEANPRPMPLLDVTAPGDPRPGRVAPEADLRTDLPRYRVYRHGELAAEVTDVRDLWREDLVAFLLGCSFTAEGMLLQAGVRLRHVEMGTSVPMWRTSIEVQPAGRFHGPVVVSMRPIKRSQVELATSVTEELPLAHGGQSTWAIQSGSASPTWRVRTGATPWCPWRTRFPSSGPAASPLKR